MIDFTNPNDWVKRESFLLEKIPTPFYRDTLYTSQAILIICGQENSRKTLGTVSKVIETSKGMATLKPSILKEGRNLFINPDLGQFTLEFDFTYWVRDRERQEIEIEIWDFTGDFIYPPSGNNEGGNSFTKLSELENDTGFITINDIPDFPTIPTQLSELDNDTGFITSAFLTWENINNKPSIQSGDGFKYLQKNADETLAAGGCYFTDSINADLTINCNSLGIGEHILWQNLSSKAVFFSGISKIDAVSIATDRGLKIASGGFLELFFKNNSKEVIKLAGNYTINYLPGVTIIPTVPISATSAMTTPTALRQGTVADFFSASGYGVFASHLAGQWLRVTFPDITKVTQVTFRHGVSYPWAPTIVKVQSSPDGTTWQDEATYNVSQANGLQTITVSSNTLAQYWRLFQATNTYQNSGGYEWHMGSFSMSGLTI